MPTSDGETTESLLIITGSMGAGKSTVMAEASDLLVQRGIVHAAIDMDALALAYLPASARNDDLMYKNLASVVQNFANAGVSRFLVARAIERREDLELCRKILPATNTLVCRLLASVGTMQQRIREREIGILQKDFVARVETLNDILDLAKLEDFTLSNENRSLTVVAMEMLVKAGWIPN
jgi:adenylylsulfate kinase